MRGQLVIAGTACCLLFVSGLALDCIVGNGASYRGTVSVTKTGKTCQEWDSRTPHEHNYVPADYPASGLEQNYCRNVGDWHEVWCYTTDPSSRWEGCDVRACGVNAALGKTAQQSSISSNGAPSRAVDGNYDPNYFADTASCTHTEEEANPTWWVDLGRPIMFGRVIIINRGDCCQERLNPFNIHIGDSELIHTNPKCGGDHQIDVNQPAISVPCEGMRGRYVGIRLPGTPRILTLCEVHISAEVMKCSPGYFRCANKYTCILSWRRCDGTPDCSDGSDEEECVCSRIHKDFQIRSRLTMLPNQLHQATFDDIQNSTAVELLNSSYSIAGKHHPELREFVSTVLFPRCNLTKENIGRQLLPCRSWCEEVFSMSGDLMRDLLPPCEVFPSPPHRCWNPEPDKNEGSTEVCYYGTGINYRGTWNTTTYGAKCLEWSADNYKTEYPWANLDKNYCRNPTGLQRPFCLTEDGSKEECDVIPCNSVSCADRGPPTNGKRTPSKRFYLLDEKVTYTCNDGYMLEYGYPREVRCQQGNSSSVGVWEHHMPTCSVNYKRRLQKELLETYSASLAPEENVTINFTGVVEEIVDLDEKKEQLLASLIIDFTWYDARLKWDPKYYGDNDRFSIPGKDIWIPPFTLRKNANPLHQGLPKDVPVRVSNTGLVQWRVETLTTTVCEANPFLFPADTMECEVCFSATTAIEQTIQCHEGSSASDVRHPCGFYSPAEEDGEWYRSVKISDEQNQTKACFALHLARIPKFHIATTVGPCVILIVLMTITFIMPIGVGDRISFGVTIQLSMVVSLVFVTEVLPVKGSLPFFATVIIVCMGLMGLFLFLTLAVIFIHGKKGSLSPMTRVIFLRYTARILLLGDLTEGKQASTGIAYEDPMTNLFDRDMTSTGSSGENEPMLMTTEAVKKENEDLVQAVKIGMTELKNEMKKLTKAVKNEEEVSEYTLLAKVLDRLCLILYVISIVVAIPFTLSKE